MYSITHPNRQGVPLVDLSEDEVVKDKLDGISALTCKQLALERVMVKVFDVLRFNGIITDRIKSLFATKLHRMGNNLQSQDGGRGKHKLLEKWKQSVWVIELTKDEIPVASRKRQSESVVGTKTKLTRLEGELKESKAKHCDTTNQIHLLEQSTKKLSYALAESGISTGKQTRRKKTGQNIQNGINGNEKRQLLLMSQLH